MRLLDEDKARAQVNDSNSILLGGVVDYSDRVSAIAKKHLNDKDTRAAHLAKQIVYLSGQLKEAAKGGNRKDVLQAMDRLFNHTADFLGGQKKANERMMHVLTEIGDTQSRLGAILEFYRTKRQVKSLDEAHW